MAMVVSAISMWGFLSVWDVMGCVPLDPPDIEGALVDTLCDLAHSYRAPRVSEQLPIGVLVSGTGTNLQALLDTVHGREAQIVAVASSTADAQALERARARGCPAEVFARADFETRGARDEALAAWLLERGVRLVVAAGYMELLGESFLARFPGAVINVHPSLLPAFPGMHAIEQALEYGVKVFGVTVHFVEGGWTRDR